MQRSPGALRLDQKISDKAASRDSAVTRNAWSVTHLDSAALSIAEEQDVMLYVEAAAAHTQG